VLASLVFVGGAAGAASRRACSRSPSGLTRDQPVTQDYVTSQLTNAANDDYDAAVILLDTPGGSRPR
jgi:hypothetical protein